MEETQSAGAYVAELEEEDSEWEYEYDETETESFYVTLDISSAADYNKLGPKKKKPDPSPPKIAQPTTSSRAQDNADPSEVPESPAPEAPAPMETEPTQVENGETSPLSERQDHIQILDLHTNNPLISYQNKLYSCEWTSTLGTDILLAPPATDFPHPVLREKPDVSVLGTSSVKLMGRPAQISSRHTAEETAQSPSPAASSNLIPTQGNTAASETPTPVKIPLGPNSTLARQNQAKFLERLIAIKAKKGEKDTVTVYTQKVNQGSGWRSQRKASEAAQDESTGNPTPRAMKASGGRPRGSRRMKGPRTAKGGLFRDYRPRLWDEPGADIRGGTPESWDQLEGSEGQITSTNPLPAEQTVSPGVSGSASAGASPTPSSRPTHSVYGEDGDVASGALQRAVVMGDNTVPDSGQPDVEMDVVQ